MVGFQGTNLSKSFAVMNLWFQEAGCDTVSISCVIRRLFATRLHSSRDFGHLFSSFFLCVAEVFSPVETHFLLHRHFDATPSQ